MEPEPNLGVHLNSQAENMEKTHEMNQKRKCRHLQKKVKEGIRKMSEMNKKGKRKPGWG